MAMMLVMMRILVMMGCAIRNDDMTAWLMARATLMAQNVWPLYYPPLGFFALYNKHRTNFQSKWWGQPQQYEHCEHHEHCTLHCPLNTAQYTCVQTAYCTVHSSHKCAHWIGVHTAQGISLQHHVQCIVNCAVHTAHCTGHLITEGCDPSKASLLPCQYFETANTKGGHQ